MGSRRRERVRQREKLARTLTERSGRHSEHGLGKGQWGEGQNQREK